MWEDDYTNEFSIYTLELDDEAGRTTKNSRLSPNLQFRRRMPEF